MSDEIILGFHLICELEECKKEKITDNQYTRSSFKSIIRECDLTIVDEGGYSFMPFGFSYFLLLSESHASIHIWPEYSYCAIDLFTCNLNLDIKKFASELNKCFNPKKLSLKQINRGCNLK